MKIIRFVTPYLFKYKGYLFFLLLFSYISRGLSIIFPYLTGNFIDVLVQSSDYRLFINIASLILVIGIFNIMSSYIQGYIHVKIQSQSMIDLNFEVLEHIVKLPIRYFEDKDSSYLNHRINNDSSVVINFLLENLLNITVNTISIIILLFISFTINKKMTLILVPVFPLYLFLYHVFRKQLYNKNYDLKEKQNNFFSKMNQHLQNINLIKINSTFDEAQALINNSFKKMLNSLLGHTKVSLLFTNSNSFIIVLANGVIFFYGGYEVLNGNMTIGEFTIINSYFSMLMGNLRYFLEFGDLYQKSLVSYDRIMEIYDIPKEINGDFDTSHVQNIKLENVSFSYNGHDFIISNLNKEFKKGKIYSIIGSNGTGKSTLINLIVGIYNDYFTGEIYYDNKEIRELNMYEIRKKIIGVCQQESRTLNSKLIDNITYGLEEYSYERLNLLLRDFNLGVDKFSNGMETIIDEASNNISGGEKLKISLIRNFLKEPEVLIMDEPTSALDQPSIEKLKYLIVDSKENRITIIISHDKNFINISDEVINLQESMQMIS